MARKVFISILGTGYYNRTKYYSDKVDSFVETRFVQEATLKLLTQDWDKNDHAYFFLTKSARESNWNDPAQTNHTLVRRGERDTYTGLSKILKGMALAYQYDTIDIPDGNNEEDIWKIFQIVYNRFSKNDEIYFDITHAFRSIPMLVMVLINYAKFLKNIKVKSITYGNWESRNEENLSPIIDITSFSELQDWTNAANNFVNFGNSGSISELANKKIKPILRETKGADEIANGIRNFSKNITQLTEALSTNRAFLFEEGILTSKILKEINILEQHKIIEPLKPLLNKTKEKIESFSENDPVLNIFRAVRWCLDANLIQQAYSLLREGMINYILSIVFPDEYPQYQVDPTFRELVSAALKIISENLQETNWNEIAKKNKEFIQKIIEFDLLSDLIKEYVSLGQYRNDIMHAGFRSDRHEASKLIKKIEKSYNTIYSLII